MAHCCNLYQMCYESIWYSCDWLLFASVLPSMGARSWRMGLIHFLAKDIWAMMIVWRMREDYQNCSVLHHVPQFCTVISTPAWAVLIVELVFECCILIFSAKYIRRTNRRAFAMMFVRLYVWPSIRDGRALWIYCGLWRRFNFAVG